MRYIFRKFLTKGLIALMLLGLLITPALAAGTVTLNLSRTSGHAGDSVIISGTAGAGQWVSIKIIDGGGNIVCFSAALCGSAGDYSDSWAVPDVQPGSLKIIAGYGSDVVSADFTVESNYTPGPGPSPDTGDGKDTGTDITIEDNAGNSIGGTKTETENGAKVDIPRDDFDDMAGKSNGKMSIELEIAKVTFNGKAVDSISGSADSGDISLTIEQVSPSALPEKVQAKVGDRPVIDFTLMAGNTQISNFAGRATVSVPYTLHDGENPKAVVMYYMDDSGKLRAVRGKYNVETGTVDFIVRHFSVYAVGYNEVAFSDVAEGAWYYDAVTFCAAREITDGTGSGLFSPGDTLTRGQFIIMLMRAYGIDADESISDNFDDAGDTYYTKYLAAAKQLGITKGVGNNLFAPESGITRQDMFTLLYRALDVLEELPEANGGAAFSDFGDTGSVSNYAKAAMETLISAGAVSGSGGNLDPLEYSTRAQMVKVLYNLLSQ